MALIHGSREDSDMEGHVKVPHFEEHSLFGLRRAFRDPYLLKDKRVVLELLSQEERFLPITNYFNFIQKDIRPWMRQKVVDWMQMVCDEQKCDEDVFPLSVNYLDRFLSLVNIPRSSFQIIASVSLFLASKLKESEPQLSAKKLSVYTDSYVCSQDIVNGELDLLNKLKWNLSAVTPFDFVDYMLTQLPVDGHYEVIRSDAMCVVKSCLISDVKFSTYPPSVVMAGSILFSSRLHFGESASASLRLVEKLQQIIDSDFLTACVEQIQETVGKDQDDWGRRSVCCITPTDIRDIEQMG